MYLPIFQNKRQDYVNRPWKQTLIDHSKRQAELKDKPHEDPPKLLMIRLVKPVKGRPQKERDILRDLGVAEVRSCTVIEADKA